MDEVGGTATPNNIAENTGISYVTVKKYIKKLLEEGILEIEDEEGKESKKK